MEAWRSFWAMGLVAVDALAVASIAPTPAPPAMVTRAAMVDSVVYHLSPESVFEVRTGKGGVLGFAGHEHLIRARRFSGIVVYYPDAPQASRVAIHVDARALEVLTPPDTEEIRKVTEAMRSEVLQVDRYPEILFESRSIDPNSGGFRIQSRLTIAGQTREVPVDVQVQIAGDTVRADARFSVKQTDFGIRPYRGGPLGTVRVADRVDFLISALAVAGAPPD